MKYAISDGRGSYIKQDATGCYVPVRNVVLCTLYDKRATAANILKSSLSKALKKRYHVIEVEEYDEGHEHKDEKHIVANIDIAKKIANEEIEDDKISEVEEQIDIIASFAESASERKDTLNLKLSEVDKEISDLEHYIELGEKFDAYKGWLAFSMLRNRLKKRRKIKNELKVVTQLGECKLDADMILNIRDVINNIGNQKYQPRVLNELFE